MERRTLIDLGETQARSLVPHPHEPVRLIEGNRLQQDAVHYAEYGAVRADTDRQRGQGHDRDQRCPHKPADGVSKPGDKVMHRCLLLDAN